MDMHAEEHTSLTAEWPATAITIPSELEYRKLIGQGSDGAALLSGKDTGV